MPSASAHSPPEPLPFAHLDPPTVLEALEAVGRVGDGRILQLNSFENRVYRVMLEDGSAVVAKFYRAGRWSDAQILEEHDFTLALAAQDLAVVAPLTLELSPWAVGRGALSEHTLLTWPAADPGAAAWRLSISPWLGGRDPEVEHPAAFERLGRLMGRLHAVGTQAPFAHRLQLGPHLAQEAIETLLRHDLIDPSLLPAWTSAAQRCAQAIEARFEAVGPVRAIRLHGDAHRGNVLERDATFHLVDFDDACLGPAVQDLWLFLEGNDQTLRQQQWSALLRGYEDFMTFDDAEAALIEPLRALRVLRHAAWIAQRWADPAFPRAFPHFATPNHWSDHIQVLQELVDRMGA